MAPPPVWVLVLLAILIIAVIVFALWWITESISIPTVNPGTIPSIPIPPIITVGELLEEIAQKKAEWDALVADNESSLVQPNNEECDVLIAIRDTVSQKIIQAQGLGASAALLNQAVGLLAEMNQWLVDWDCV